MSVIRGLAVLSLVSALQAARASAVWPNNGPPGVVDALAVSPVDGAVYAITDEGLYRSADHGKTWTRTGPDVAMVHAPGTLAVDSTNTLYATLSREDGVLTSHDGGQTLLRLSGKAPPACAFRDVFAFAPSQPSTIYLARCGLFRSDDSGGTWSRLSFPHVLFSLAVDPLNPRRVLLGGYEGIWISEDEGETSRSVLSGPSYLVEDLEFDPSNPARVLTAVPGSYQVGRSEDGGETWVQSSSGYFGFDASALAFDPQDPKIVYVNTHGVGPIAEGTPLPNPPPTGVNVSTDGGLSWRSLAGSPPIADLLVGDPAGRWIYAVYWGSPGVFVYDARPDRPQVIRPAPRGRPPRPVPRTPGQSVEPQ